MAGSCADEKSVLSPMNKKKRMNTHTYDDFWDEYVHRWKMLKQWACNAFTIIEKIVVFHVKAMDWVNVLKWCLWPHFIRYTTIADRCERFHFSMRLEKFLSIQHSSHILREWWWPRMMFYMEHWERTLVCFIHFNTFQRIHLMCTVKRSFCICFVVFASTTARDWKLWGIRRQHENGNVNNLLHKMILCCLRSVVMW